jgi:type I restriction enzyme S subunit
MLASEQFTEYANGESQRSRMPKLNREQLFSWEAPIPPLEEQRRLAATLDRQSSAARDLCAKLTERLKTLDRLPAALLSRAFHNSNE